MTVSRGTSTYLSRFAGNENRHRSEDILPLHDRGWLLDLPANDFSSLNEIPSRDTVGTVPSRVGTPAQHESNCPDSESGRPDLVPTRLPFESGRQQPRGGTDDRDEYDL